MSRKLKRHIAGEMTTHKTLRPSSGRGDSRSPDEPVRSGRFDSWTTRDAISCVVLAVATIALYSPVIGHPFLILDDNQYVVANPRVHEGLSWSTIKWALTSTTASNWHPLTWLSHAFDCQFFGLNPAGHHADGIMIHALNVVLLFLLLRWLTARARPSLLVAALFAWHPLNVESVAWVAERKNVLSTFFFLAAIGAYAWYAQKPRWDRYLAVIILFAFGLMAKPMVITLPFVLLLLDYWPLHRVPGSPPSACGATPVPVARLFLEKLPLLLLSAASSVITLKAQQADNAVRTLHQFPIMMRIENAVVAYSLYLWKMLWPARLAVLYPYPATGLPTGRWISCGLVLLSISAVDVVFRSRRYLLVGWLWYLGILVPVAGLVQVGDQALADRYAYVPLIGMFIIVAWGLAELSHAYRVDRRWQIASAACALLALGIVTYRQLSCWDSEYDLWVHTVAVTGENPIAQDALAAALMQPDVAMSAIDLQEFDTDQKRVDEARGHYRQALASQRELAPTNPGAYLPDLAYTLINFGNLEQTENNLEQARQYYEEAVQIHTRIAQQSPDPYPEDAAAALTNLGALEKTRLENDKGLHHFEAALAIYRGLVKQDPVQYLPNVAELLNNLAITERDMKHMDEARQYYEDMLPIRRQLVEQNRKAYLPSLAITLNDLGILDGLANRNDDARKRYEEAAGIYRQLAREDSSAYTRYLAGTLSNLASLYGNQNRMQEARAVYHESLTLYQELARDDPAKYAGDVARVEASLTDLDKKSDPK